MPRWLSSHHLGSAGVHHFVGGTLVVGSQPHGCRLQQQTACKNAPNKAGFRRRMER